MSNATLEEIQQIEMEAMAIKASYDEQIKSSYNEIQKRLQVAEVTFDEETKGKVEALEQTLNAQNTQLQERLERTIESQKAHAQKLLEQQRHTLVNQIIGEVVKEYGN